MKDERKLIQMARGGDADAFCSLYGLYRESLYRYAFYRLRSEADAEDAVSECVLAVWRQIGALRETDAFRAWIFRILSGCCNKLIRQQIERRNQMSLDDPAQGFTDGRIGGGQTKEPSPCQDACQDGRRGTSDKVGTKTVSAGADHTVNHASAQAPAAGRDDALRVVEHTDTWLILQEALAQISEEERNIVLLSAVGGLKSREIAELTGMTAGSVRSALSRSLKKVRGYLQ